VNYDASLVSPVFYGKMHHKLHNVDTSFSEFDPAIAHPACLGHTFVDAAPPSPPKTPPPAPDKKTCKSIVKPVIAGKVEYLAIVRT